MNLFRAVKDWSKRYVGGAGFGGAGGSFAGASSLPAPVLSGIAVTPETALTFSAWYACIVALSTDLAALPFGVERYRPGKGRTPVPNDPRHDLLYCEPNRHLGSLEFRRTVYSHRFGWGNGYAKILRRNGWPVELQIQSPRDTDTWPVLSRTGDLWYETEGGRGPAVRSEDMLHLRGLGWSGLKGFSPVALHRQGIGYGLAIEQFGAAFYGNAATPRGALKVTKRLNDEGRKNLRESVAGVHADTTNAHRLMILEEGTEFQAFSVDPKDAEYVATRKFQAEEMCRILSVPPPRIMDFSGTTSVYKALSDMIQQYLTFTLGPETVATQQETDRKLFTSRERTDGLRSYHDFGALLKADPVTRMTYLEKRFGLGSITPDEIREQEGDPPTPGAPGDQFYVASTYSPVSKPAPSDGTAVVGTDPAGTTVDVQATALNGAQIESLLSVVNSVTAGTIPLGSAEAILGAAFPTVSKEMISAIISPLNGFEPADGQKAPADGSNATPADQAQEVPGGDDQ